jgi:hypothetical protein
LFLAGGRPRHGSRVAGIDLLYAAVGLAGVGSLLNGAATALNPLTIALWTASFPAAAPDRRAAHRRRLRLSSWASAPAR